MSFSGVFLKFFGYAHEVLEFYIIVYLSFKWQVSFARECYNLKYE